MSGDVKLVLCPCCGEMPILLDNKLGRARLFYVKCKTEDCGLSTPQCDSAYRAIGIWNRRSSSAAASGVVGLGECCRGVAPLPECACARWEVQEEYARRRGVKSILPHPFPNDRSAAKGE